MDLQPRFDRISNNMMLSGMREFDQSLGWQLEQMDEAIQLVTSISIGGSLHVLH